LTAGCPSCGAEVLAANAKPLDDGLIRHEIAVCYVCRSSPLHLWRHAAIGDGSVPWRVEPAGCGCPRPGSDPLEGV